MHIRILHRLRLLLLYECLVYVKYVVCNVCDHDLRYSVPALLCCSCILIHHARNGLMAERRSLKMKPNSLRAIAINCRPTFEHIGAYVYLYMFLIYGARALHSMLIDVFMIVANDFAQCAI